MNQKTKLTVTLAILLIIAMLLLSTARALAAPVDVVSDREVPMLALDGPGVEHTGQGGGCRIYQDANGATFAILDAPLTDYGGDGAVYLWTPDEYRTFIGPASVGVPRYVTNQQIAVYGYDSTGRLFC